MKKNNTLLIGAILVVTFFFSQCKKDTHYYQIKGYAQGTTYNIIYESLQDKDYSTEIDSILKEFDKSLSVYKSNSIISKINNNDSNVVLDKWFIECFKTGKKIFKQTNGAFDMTVAPLADAYGFWKNPHLQLDSSQIDSIMQYVGFDKIKLENNKIIKKSPNVKIDVDAIAQGYSVDVVAQFLEQESCNNYLVEIGGELKTKGVNQSGKKWRVGIDKPIDNPSPEKEEFQTIISLSNKSLATSGDYRRFYIENGIKYAHTINPKTGYPARSDLLSVSVIAPKCIEADAYATSFMVLGFEKSLSFVEKNKNLEAYFIYRDAGGKLQTKMSSGFEKQTEK